ncbi:hypothetical protein KAH27_10385 [bacterium]|nr:hypothetical protein [bacterium]
MKKTLVFLLSILLTYTILQAQSAKEGEFESGIVFGPKGAFQISAPEDWILNNKIGQKMGLHCVLYIDGFTWNNSPVIMYAKIASPEYEKIDKFLEFAIEAFVKEDPEFKHKEFKIAKIDGQKYIIMDYIGGPYKSYERVGYIQMEKAVAFVVFSARNEEDFKKYADAILEIVESFEYKPEYIGYEN